MSTDRTLQIFREVNKEVKIAVIFWFFVYCLKYKKLSVILLIIHFVPELLLRGN